MASDDYFGQSPGARAERIPPVKVPERPFSRGYYSVWKRVSSGADVRLFAFDVDRRRDVPCARITFDPAARVVCKKDQAGISYVVKKEDVELDIDGLLLLAKTCYNFMRETLDTGNSLAFIDELDATGDSVVPGGAMKLKMVDNINATLLRPWHKAIERMFERPRGADPDLPWQERRNGQYMVNLLLRVVATSGYFRDVGVQYSSQSDAKHREYTLAFARTTYSRLCLYQKKSTMAHAPERRKLDYGASSGSAASGGGSAPSDLRQSLNLKRAGQSSAPGKQSRLGASVRDRLGKKREASVHDRLGEKRGEGERVKRPRGGGVMQAFSHMVL